MEDGPATGAPTTTTPSAGLIVALSIVYLSRRSKIGGWLLYYYVQLYGSVLISAIVVPTIAHNLNPNIWDTSAHYVWYVLTVIPLEAATLAEVALATILLWKRNEAMLQRLRQVLLALVVISLASLCVDYLQYTRDQTNAALDMMSLVSAMIWSAQEGDKSPIPYSSSLSPGSMLW